MLLTTVFTRKERLIVWPTRAACQQRGKALGIRREALALTDCERKASRRNNRSTLQTPSWKRSPMSREKLLAGSGTYNGTQQYPLRQDASCSRERYRGVLSVTVCAKLRAQEIGMYTVNFDKVRGRARQRLSVDTLHFTLSWSRKWSVNNTKKEFPDSAAPQRRPKTLRLEGYD